MSEILKCIDMFDAAVFTGDDFHDEENRKQLRTFLARWERELESLQKLDEEDRPNAHVQPEITEEQKSKGLEEIKNAKWEKDEWGAVNLVVTQPNGHTATCMLTLRPTYCDRGHIQLNIEAAGMGLDNSDSFPRFFFSFEEADAHTREFLRWRLYKVRSNPHELTTPKERLVKLKEIGDNQIKGYNDPIPKECIILLDEFIVTYVTEHTLMGYQPTLSLSHVSGKKFDKFKYEEEIKEIFGKSKMENITNYPQRGYTTQYVYKER